MSEQRVEKDRTKVIRRIGGRDMREEERKKKSTPTYHETKNGRIYMYEGHRDETRTRPSMKNPPMSLAFRSRLRVFSLSVVES